MRKFIQRADDALFFDGETIPQIKVDGVESCWMAGDQINVIYFQHQPAFVDGIIQMRRRPIACLMASLTAAKEARMLVSRMMDRMPEAEASAWLGSKVN